MIRSKKMEEDDSSQFCFKCESEIKQGTSYLCISLTVESEVKRIIDVSHADSLIIRCKECGLQDVFDAIKPFMIPEERLESNPN